MKLMVRNRNAGKTYADGRKKPPNWEWRFHGAMVDGKRTDFSKSGYATKKEAQDAGNKAISEYTNTGGVFSPNDISVHDYLSYWISTYGKNSLKESTIQHYKSIVKNKIDPIIGKYYLKDINTSTLQEIIFDEFNKGTSRDTLSCIKTILNESMEYAMTNCGYINSNPANQLTLPGKRAIPDTVVERKTRRAITDNEWQLLMKLYPEGHIAHLPFVLGYKCGLRAGEVFGLMWSDIDFEKNTLTVNRQVQLVNKKHILSPPKYDSYRTISVDKSTMALLARTKALQDENKEIYAEYYKGVYVADARHDKHPFSHGTFEESGTPVDMITIKENGSMFFYSYFASWIHRMHVKGIMQDVSFHCLRHTHATKLLENGVPMPMIQKRLGHTNVEITTIYVHPTEKMERDLVAQLDDIF